MSSSTDADRSGIDLAVALPACHVGADDAVAAVCPHCGRPFAATDARDLHVGEVHGATCSAAEHAAYETARDAERDDLFYYHLRVVVAIGVLYALTVLVYMIALGSGLL